MFSEFLETPGPTWKNIFPLNGFISQVVNRVFSQNVSAATATSGQDLMMGSQGNPKKPKKKLGTLNMFDNFTNIFF